VADAYGNGVAGESLSWSVTAGGGSINPNASTTDANGDISATWTVGSDTAVTNTLDVSNLALPGTPKTVSLSAGVIAAAPSQLAWIQAPPSTVYQNQTLSPAVTVQLKDQYGNLSTATGKNVDIRAYSDSGCTTAASSFSSGTVASSSGVATFSAAKYTGSSSVYVKAVGGTSSGISSPAGDTTCVAMTVYPTLTITPTSATIAGGAGQLFAPGGGNGTYNFDFTRMDSGNATVDGSGNYVAGTNACGTDIVRLRDTAGSAQQTVLATITVNGIANLIQEPYDTASQSYNMGTLSIDTGVQLGVRNSGCATSGPIAVTLTNATDPSAFTITGTDFCNGSNLNANTACSNNVTFHGGSLASGTTYSVDVVYTISSGTGAGNSFTQHLTASTP
jgi:hypothetical protein